MHRKDCLEYYTSVITEVSFAETELSEVCTVKGKTLKAQESQQLPVCLSVTLCYRNILHLFCVIFFNNLITVWVSIATSKFYNSIIIFFLTALCTISMTILSKRYIIHEKHNQLVLNIYSV